MMNRLRAAHREEAGQALILMIMAMTLVFLAGVMVVDFGFWFSGRASLVNATDQASMSASLQLTGSGADSYNSARNAAINYLQENDPDVNVSDIDVSFRCIVGDRDQNGQADLVDIPVTCPQLNRFLFSCSDVTWLCYADCDQRAADNAKCNTVIVGGERDIPFGFGDTFGVTEGNAGFRSGACRGLCGAAPMAPLDLVIILDRTSSMCPGNNDCGPDRCLTAGRCPNLDNAKAAARSVLTFLNPDIQHVALGVLGQSNTSSQSGCPSGILGIATTSGTQPGTWLPVPLGSNYQHSDGTLDTSSNIVRTINCLNSSNGSGTNLGDPVHQARQYLLANGRPGVKKGILLMTDGAANRPLGNPGTPVVRFCTTSAAVTASSGDNNGYQTTPLNACANDGNFASDPSSGSGTSTACDSNQKDRQRLGGFGITIPSSPTPTIDGIEVRLDARASSGATVRRLCVRLSWNGGSSWTSTRQVDLIGTSELTYTVGTLEDDWGRTWSLSNLANASFVVEVTNVANNAATTFDLEAVSVTVGYHTPATIAGGPCQYAADRADQARGDGIEIFTIGYGVSGDICDQDGAGSNFDQEVSTRLLAYMANGHINFDDGGDGVFGLPYGCPDSGPFFPDAIDSENLDGDYFLCEARGADLEPLFRAAAAALASSSRLVRIPPGF